MASTVHQKAEKDYLNGMKYKELAEKYNVSLNTIKSWKQRYNWNRKSVHTKEKVCTQKTGAPKGNKNALGNSGGAAPAGNKNAETHGFFSRIFPDDPETMAIISEIGIKSSLDILWENIVIQYTAIARAQRIMYVKDRDDMTGVLKRHKTRETTNTSEEEKEWELQHAWDKQANFLQAQTRAIDGLQKLITRYEEMLPGALKHEEQRLRLEKLKAEICKINNPEVDKPIEITIVRKGEAP